SRMPDDGRRPTMNDEKRERHRIGSAGSVAHRMKWSPHARQSGPRYDDVVALARRIVVRCAGEESRVRGEVGQGRVPPAIGNGDARVEIAPVRDFYHGASGVPTYGVVIGPIGGEIIRHRAKVAVTERERHEDLLLD